jgi:hypothetical protein
MDMKPVKIGGELFWSNWMHNFNTKFNEDNKKYECTIGNLSDKAAEALKELGIQIKEKDTMGKYIVGKSLYKFEPVDNDGNKVDIERIGNGTKVTALVSSYRHKMSAKYGAAPSIKMLIVTELKEYNPEPKDDAEDDDIL